MSSSLLSYRDAVRILDASTSPVVTAVGRLTGVAAAGATVASLGTVDFFALRDELLRWGHATVAGVRGRVSGLRRLDRTEKLVAVHAVLVVTAFFDALDQVLEEHRGVGLDAAELTRAEQLRLITGASLVDGRPFYQALLDATLPMPEPQWPLESTLDSLAGLYEHAADMAALFLGGLAAFDGEHETLTAVRRQVGDRALEQYAAAYRSLAADVPEFAAWVGLVDAQATRAAVHDTSARVRAQLSGLTVDLRATAERLTTMSEVPGTEEVPRGLSTRHAEALRRPILAPAQTPEHVTLPALADAYVDPRGLVRIAGPSDLPGTEAWWSGAPVSDDVHTFLVSHLTGPSAVLGPLVVLGQPGSGKSVLTRVLAARLGCHDFLPVRVELRNVAADSPVQAQIETALYQAVGERVTWPELVRRFPDLLPVVMLDGFDELLQATGAKRADYLELVQEFQQREAELGRPVAVVVTSRTVVADRARFPHGSVVVRLQQFDDDQVRVWLRVWNATNEVGLASRSLRPLPAEAALRYPALAGQPLLLLLLALYDAGGNALQRGGTELGEVDLYERLFADFIRREVHKDAPAAPEDAYAQAVELEWRRLSAVAMAMLNRGTEVLTDAQLDVDVEHLLGSDASPTVRLPDTGSRPLTLAQLLVGRFFFIHESQASLDTGGPEKSFEFLHATFGDFLAARMLIDALVDLADERVHQRSRRQGTLDVGFFYATTSFVTITRRAPLLEFCKGLLARLTPEQRTRCRDLLLELLPDAGFAHPSWSLGDYEPRRKSAAARQAAFSANLVCLAVLLTDQPVPIPELVGEPALSNWQKLALLWFGQLDPEDRQRIWQVTRVTWHGSTLIIGPEDGSPVSMYASLPWPPDVPPTGKGPALPDLTPDLVVPSETHLGRALRKSAFVQTAIEVREYLYLVAPYWRTIGDINWIGPDARLLDAHLLIRLLLEPADTALRETLLSDELFLTYPVPYRDEILRQLENDPTLDRAGLRERLDRLKR